MAATCTRSNAAGFATAASDEAFGGRRSARPTNQPHAANAIADSSATEPRAARFSAARSVIVVVMAVGASATVALVVVIVVFVFVLSLVPVVLVVVARR